MGSNNATLKFETIDERVDCLKKKIGQYILLIGVQSQDYISGSPQSCSRFNAPVLRTER